MMLVTTKEMLLKAQQGHYAVPAFNIHNLETIQSVVETAAQMKSPLILAGTPGTIDYAGAEYLVAIANAAAKKYSIPLALHLDHFEEVDQIKEYIDSGFTSAMMDASKESFQDNIKKVTEIVQYAHSKGRVVEAELGKLVGAEENLIVDEKDSCYTNPDAAREFVVRTQIDSLAVAIGTAHGLYKGKPKLDFERLAQIKAKVAIPLVLHGASDVPEELVKKTIALGICKVNIATDLKIPFAQAIKQYFQEHAAANDPRKYLTPGKNAMKVVAAAKILMCGSENKA